MLILKIFRQSFAKGGGLIACKIFTNAVQWVKLDLCSISHCPLVTRQFPSMGQLATPLSQLQLACYRG